MLTDARRRAWWFSPPVRRTRLLAIVAVVQVGGTFGASRDQPEATSIDALAIALLLLGPVSLWALWRKPVLAMWAAVAVTVVYVGRGYPYGPFVVTPLIGFVRAVMEGHRRVAWMTAAVGVAAAAIAHTVSPRPEGFEWSGLLGVTTWAVIVLVGSEVVRTNRERRRQTAMARVEQRRRQASEERLRIAQELHDVLAHDISLINVQAGVGLHLVDTQPEQARAALSTIKQASKEALTELRAALELLRNGESAPRTPTGGVDDIDALASRLRSPHLDVRVERSGAGRPLRPGVDLAAFRIVQEALTNVVRHAAGATCAVVRIDFDEEALTVEVEDDGRASTYPDDHAGSGIAGMQARVDALGAELYAGPRAEGGFLVRARFPLTMPAEGPAEGAGDGDER